MSYKDRSGEYQTAALGNELRVIALQWRTELKDRTDATLKPIHEFLVSLMLKSDRAILNKNKLPIEEFKRLQQDAV